MSEGKKEIEISLVEYSEDMGPLHLPEGFEEHLKGLRFDYNKAMQIEAMKDDDECDLFSVRLRYSSRIVRQMHCYGWADNKDLVEWDDPRLVAEEPDPDLKRQIKPITLDKDEIRLIVKDHMVVGVMLSSFIGWHKTENTSYTVMEDEPILPYCGYVYDSTSDNNGAGYKKREWYRYLICLPKNHNLW